MFLVRYFKQVEHVGTTGPLLSFVSFSFVGASFCLVLSSSFCLVVLSDSLRVRSTVLLGVRRDNEIVTVREVGINRCPG